MCIPAAVPYTATVMKIGDIVEPNGIEDYVLACGSGVYPNAVVANIDPLVLISDTGDMRWSASIKEEWFRVIGTADKYIMERVEDRIHFDVVSGQLKI